MKRSFILNRIVCAAGILTVFLTGCSPAARDKLLRTLIDGVLEPAAEGSGMPPPTAAVPPPAATTPEAPRRVIHPPFAEQMCDSCHDSKFSQKLAAEGKELCFTCHDDFTQGEEGVHYPAEEGLCLECHDPHQSPHKALLKKEPKEICYICHDDFTKDKKYVHPPVAQGLCLKCHNPHQADGPALTIQPVPGLCFTCHQEAAVMAQPQHEDQDQCLECHDVHASDAERLLK